MRKIVAYPSTICRILYLFHQIRSMTLLMWALITSSWGSTDKILSFDFWFDFWQFWHCLHLDGHCQKTVTISKFYLMKKIWRFLLFKTILLTGWRLQIKCSKTSFPRWRLWNPRDFQLSFSLWSFSAASAVVAYRQARDRFRSAGAAKPAGNYILLELWRSRWKLWREQSIIYVTSSHICFSNAEAGISSMDAAGPSPYARFLSTVAKRNTYFFSAMGKSQLGFPVGLYGDVNA